MTAVQPDLTGIPRPHIDLESAPFWAATREHRLVVQRCDSCRVYRFPPKPICPGCRSGAASWVAVSGRGRLVSWVSTHHVTHPAFARQLPYTVVYVELIEQRGLMMYGDLRGDMTDLRVGDAVQAVFEDVDADLTVVQWHRTRVSSS